MNEEAEPGNGINACKTEEPDEFPVIQKGDLPFHFKDRFFDGHKVNFTLSGQITDIGYTASFGKDRGGNCNRQKKTFLG